MAGHDSYPAQAENPHSHEWYQDGITRTVIEYPPQPNAPNGSHNVFYGTAGDTINLRREEYQIDPGTAGITPVYRLRCQVHDLATGEVTKRYYYISHDDEVILTDSDDGRPLHPIRLDRIPRQITIGAPLPAAEMSNLPINPAKRVTVESLLLFADQWMATPDDKDVDVRFSPFIDDTLPRGVIPRRQAPVNPIVRVLPHFLKN